MHTGQTIHATSVALRQSAVLIKGASGTGKSSLGLFLMAAGCNLVADDRVILTRNGETIWVAAPQQTFGLIEARFVGLLRAAPLPKARLAFVVDLDHEETERLPPTRSYDLLGVKLPLIYGRNTPHLAPAILQMLKEGRSET